MNKSSLLIILSFTEKSLSAQNKLIFEKMLFDYHRLQVHYIRKTLDDRRKKKILIGVIRHSESGFYIKLYGDLEGWPENRLLEAGKLYKQVQLLKDDFVKVSNLDLDYFEQLFVYLIASNSLLVVAFVLRKFFKVILKKVENCLKFMRKKLRLLKRTINEYKAHLQLRLKWPCRRFH